MATLNDADTGGGSATGGGIANPGGSVTLQNGSSVSDNTPDNCAEAGTCTDPDGARAAP